MALQKSVLAQLAEDPSRFYGAGTSAPAVAAPSTWTFNPGWNADSGVQGRGWYDESGRMYEGEGDPNGLGLTPESTDQQRQDASYKASWDQIPGSSNLEKWQNARQTFTGGMVELGDWAVRNGLLSQQDLPSNQWFTESIRRSQDASRFTQFGRTAFGLGSAAMLAGAGGALLGYGSAAPAAAEGAAATAGLSQAEIAALIESGATGTAGGAMEAAALGGATAGGAMSSEAWIDQLLRETGEAGIDPAMLEGGFNPALSNAPWWSGMPTWVQNAAQGATSSAANGAGGTGGSLLAQLAGAIVPAGLGAIAADRQADAFESLNREYMAMGAPSRARYESSFAPGFSMSDEPGYQDMLNQTSKGILHGLSVQGSPADSPNAWKASLNDLYQSTAYPALQEYRRGNANAGGLSRFAEAAPGAASNAINAQHNIFQALGYGVNKTADIFSPPKTEDQVLADISRRFLAGSGRG